MKAMAKVGLICALLLISADASVYKGQRAYMKLCKKCHGSGEKVLAMHTQKEWQSIFDHNAKNLIQMHKGDKKAMEILQSEKFKKNLRHMRQFFHKFASDSGNVPACN